jgi:putative phosphoribosyl transferase
MKKQAKPQERAVKIEADDVVLEGNLVIPPDPRGVVLFVHGSGSSRKSPRNRYVAGVLNQASMATLLFDLLTREEERRDAPTAELRFDIGLLTERLMEATDWISEQPEFDELRIGYFGASTGAAAALVAAGIRADIGSVVSRGGRPDLAGPALPRVTAPTLFIVGGEDRVVFNLNKQAMAQMRCETRLEVIPGASHLFEEPGTLEEAARLARLWFEGHLGRVQESDYAA